MNDRFKFIKDTKLKYIGKSKRQKYMFALFECPYCHEIIETRKTIGMKQVCCKKCYKKYRQGKHFGPIKDKVKISGYLYIYAPEHPKCSKKGYVAEHRLVAEKMIGRYLTDDEVVHHINEIKTDNREENLKVMAKSEHIKYHQLQKKRGKDGKYKI
jgi:hypothetical protein